MPSIKVRVFLQGVENSYQRIYSKNRGRELSTPVLIETDRGVLNICRFLNSEFINPATLRFKVVIRDDPKDLSKGYYAYVFMNIGMKMGSGSVEILNPYVP
jgi:hypothetical protein